MKIFKADSLLADVLFQHGFQDTTAKRDVRKGKRSFKLSKSSRKEINFDYINIKIWNANLQDETTRLTDSDLKLLLLYFKLSSADIRLINQNGSFDFKKWEERINRLEKDMTFYEGVESMKLKKEKIGRVLSIYRGICV